MLKPAIVFTPARHIWDTKYPKQHPKGKNLTVKNSERAWVRKRQPERRTYKESSIRLDFIEGTRFMRWYTQSNRSDILRRLDPIFPPYDKQRHYSKWPKPVS